MSLTTHSLILATLVTLITGALQAGEVVVIAPQEHNRENAHSVAFSADGSLVAAAFGGPPNAKFPLQPRGGGVMVWEAESGRLVQSYGEYGDIIQLAFTHDDKAWLHSRMYTPGDSVDDNLSCLVDVVSGARLRRWNSRDTHVAAVSPTAGHLAVVDSRDICQVYAWTGSNVEDDPRPLAFEDAYKARCLAFSADGQRLVAVHGVLEPIVRSDGTVSKSRAIRVKGLAAFDVKTWTPSYRTTSDSLKHCTAVAVARGGRLIATGHSEGVVMVWDTLAQTPPRRLDLQTTAAVLPRFSPDGRLLAVLTQPANSPTWKYSDTPSGFEFGRRQVDADCELVIFDCRDFARQRHFRFADGVFRTYHANRPREALNPARMAFSPDGKRLLIGCNGVVLLDAETGAVVRQFDTAAPID